MRLKAALLVGVLSVCAGAADLNEARDLYGRTEFEQSLNVLKVLPQKDSAAYALMGQDYFLLADYKKATEALEKASAADPSNSNYELWLGRAYGRRAEKASPLTAFGLASKARQHFEQAVALDPRNSEALNDLLEYELEAPGFLGGGIDKAKATVAKIAQVSEAAGQWAQARLDEKQKEWSSAEEHLRRAIDLAPHQPGRLVDLARLLARQGRYQESDQSLERAEQLEPASAGLLYARADVYIKSHRNLDVAKSLLARYLSANITPDDPPKAQARKLLSQIGS